MSVEQVSSSAISIPKATERDAAPSSTPLPFTLKAGWAVGAAGSVAMMIVVNVLLLYFMVSMLGIDAAYAGILLAAVRVLDMFLDPIMGIISDRTKSRWGRRRPWLLIGGISSGVMTAALFIVPPAAPAATVAFVMGLMLILFYAAYTMFSVPYLAIPAEMTDDYDERTSIMSYRTAASGVAGLVGVSAAPSLVAFFGGGVSAYGWMSLILGAFVMSTMLISFAATAKARQTNATTVQRGLRSLEVLRDRSFAALIAVKFLALLGISCNAAVQLFFQVHITGRGAAGVALAGGAQHVATLVAIPVLRWCAKYVEKRTLLAGSLLVFALACLSWALSGPQESDILFITRGAALGVGYAGIVLMTLAMLPDTIHDDYSRTGLRREGIMAGVFAGIEKTAFATAPLVVGMVLSLFGFASSREADIVQSTQAIQGVQIAASVLPALFVGLAVPLLLAYRLTRQRIQAAH